MLFLTLPTIWIYSLIPTGATPSSKPNIITSQALAFSQLVGSAFKSRLGKEMIIDLPFTGHLPTAEAAAGPITLH